MTMMFVYSPDDTRLTGKRLSQVGECVSVDKGLYSTRVTTVGSTAVNFTGFVADKAVIQGIQYFKLMKRR